MIEWGFHYIRARAQDMFQPQQQSALLRIICRPKTKGTESFVSVSEKDIQRWRICGVQISGLVGGPSKKMLLMTSYFGGISNLEYVFQNLAPI